VVGVAAVVAAVQQAGETGGLVVYVMASRLHAQARGLVCVMASRLHAASSRDRGACCVCDGQQVACSHDFDRGLQWSESLVTAGIQGVCHLGGVATPASTPTLSMEDETDPEAK